MIYLGEKDHEVESASGVTVHKGRPWNVVTYVPHTQVCRDVLENFALK